MSLANPLKAGRASAVLALVLALGCCTGDNSGNPRSDVIDTWHPGDGETTYPDAALYPGGYCDGSYPRGDDDVTYFFFEYYDGCDPRPVLEECSEYVICQGGPDGPGHDVPLGTAADAGTTVEFDATWVGMEVASDPHVTTLVLSEGRIERRIVVQTDARPLATVLALDDALHVSATGSGFTLSRAPGGELLLAVVSPPTLYSLEELETPAGLGATLRTVGHCDFLRPVGLCPPQVIRASAIRAEGAAGIVTVEPLATERLETSTGAFNIHNGGIAELGPNACGCAIGYLPHVRFGVVRAE